MSYFYNPSRPSDGLPDLVKLAPPQSEPGVDVPGYLPVEYDAVNGIINMPDGEKIQFPPVPQPQPNITQFQLDCIESYEILMEYAFSSPIEGMRGKAASLANMIARLTPDGLPIMVSKWNDIFQGADLDSTIPNLINTAASTNHIPLVMNADFTLSIVM